jgi:DNA-binding response OmpR family regulator
MDFFRKKGKKILVVEDEADIAENIKARLTLDHYNVVLAGDGKTGVEKARKEKPDLVILDVMMPLVNGFEACKILKQDNETRHIPILILTALPHVDDVEKAYEMGANDFLNKPFTNDRLLQKIKKLLPPEGETH